MKKTLLVLVVALLSCILVLRLNAQVDFFPPGVEWYYGFNSPGLIATQGYTHLRVDRDTLIEGKTVKIFQETNYHFDYSNPPNPTDTSFYEFPYLAQSGDTILYYNSYDTLFEILWKQNVQGGDEFTIPDNWTPYIMHIDSTEQQVYNGLDTKKIYLSGGTGYGQDGSTIIYDRFGPTDGFGYYYCWGFYDCYTHTLCRYKNNEMGQVDFSSPVCDILSTAIKPIVTTSANVFPNPFDDVFTIDLGGEWMGKAWVEMYSLSGQLVYSKSFVDGRMIVVDMSGYGNEMYVGKVISEGRIKVFRVVKG